MADTQNYVEAVKLFARGPAILEDALNGVTPDESKFIPAPGKWTIRQIVRHLADTEIVTGMRLRQIIAEDRPNLAVFDQDLWAAAFGYNDCDVFASAALVRTLREDMTVVLQELPATAFERVGLHPERGEFTLLRWVEIFGKHVEKHAEQIARARASWSSR